MLKSDKQLLQGLASNDEALRVVSAGKLERLQYGHFEDHRVDYAFASELTSALQHAYLDTKSPLVQKWIIQFFSLAPIFTDEVIALVQSNIRADSPYLSTLMAYVMRTLSIMPDAKSIIASLALHPDPNVRWRCASAFYSLQLAKRLSYDEDIETLRRWLKDEHYTTRNYAAMAMGGFQTLQPEDRAILEQVAALNDGGSSSHAREILATKFSSKSAQ